MKLVRRHYWILLITLGCALLAGTEVREFEVSGEPNLTLSNISGDIEILPGDSDRVVVNYHREDERIEVKMSQSGDRITVETKYPKGSFRGKGGVSFEIHFPGSGQLEVSSVSGDIKLNGIQGEIDIHSVSGTVEVSNVAGDLRLGSVSGDVEMSGLGDSRVEANSVSGDIVYRRGDLLGTKYSFSSTSGDIRVSHGANASYHVRGRTLSGGIKNDIGGEIEVRKAKYTGKQSVSGTFNGGEADLNLTTVSGRITLRLER